MKGSTHIYESKRGITYYHVQSKFFLCFSHSTVHFWDKYQNKWVRSYCHPPVRKMEKV